MKLFSQKSQRVIYLDHAAATPIDLEVAKVIKNTSLSFANPSAIHRSGVEARIVLEKARKKIADCMFAHSDEIIFTGSGTESDTLAILGTVRAYQGIGKPHIITTMIEHPAVLENCRMLEKNGEAEITYVSVDARGIIDPKEIKNALRENTVLVSVMYANNEIGTIQPIMEIAKVIRHFRKAKGKEEFSGHVNFSAEKLTQSFAPSRSRAPENSSFPLLHTDACQAMNYLFTENIEKLGVDLLSFNSSKIYGPKGVGVLYKKRGVTLEPLYRGGGQEFGMRSGTENVTAIVGAALALEETNKIKEKESARLVNIRDYGIEKLLELSKTSSYGIILNGDERHRLPNNINISIAGISSELLVIELDAKGIQVSAKSACKSDEPDESYVITALRQAQNIPLNTTDGSLRISLGRQTTKADIDALAAALSSILKKYKNWN
jgi:cysteine desulfurase